MNDTIHGSLSSKKFADAALDVIKFLNQALGFDLWVVTRRNGDEYIVLQSEDHGYNTPQGSVFKWCDTFCSRMVDGLGPTFASNLLDVAAYKDAPFAKMVTVGSYLGVPLHNSDGSVFGTLCAIHPTPREEAIKNQLPMVKTFAALLSSLIDSEMENMESKRHAEHANAEAMKDAGVPMLYNRRGWDHLSQIEDKRARDFGHNMIVISIDLDGLKRINDTQGHAKGSEYILNSGKAIASVLPSQGIGARVGGDEFQILLPEYDAQQGETFLQALKDEFKKQHVEASFGAAMFNHTETFESLVDRADQMMYVEKRARKAASV